MSRATRARCLPFLLVTLLWVACKEPPEDFGTDGEEIVELSEGLCHLQGAFFRLEEVLGQLEPAEQGGGGYEELECDFDGSGEDTYYLDFDSIDWMTDTGTYSDDHSPPAGTDTVLNGGVPGWTPLIYVGGVNQVDAEVFLWMSYHGVGTYYWYSNPGYDCNTIWSWLIDDSHADLPVTATLSDYCTAAAMNTGHYLHTCKFGFFPLGAFTFTETAGGEQFPGAKGYKYVEFFDEGASQLADLTCSASTATVDSAFGSTEFRHLNFGENSHADFEVFGDEIHAGASNDSLAGLDWEKTGGDSKDFEYTTRIAKFGTSPSTFLADIDDYQDAYGFSTDCECGL